jgi:integral membrane sensor domain MASE1
VLAAVWPAGGIALAALLLSRRSDWPAISAVLFVSGLASDLLVGRPFAASCGYMTGNVVESWASAWLITRCCSSNVRFARVCDVLALLVAAVFVNAGSAAIGAGTAWLVNGSSFWGFWFTWWISDGLGILLITPLIVTCSDFRSAYTRTDGRQILELTALIVIVGVMAWKVVPNELYRSLVPRPYMLIAPLAWACLRLGRRSVSVLLTLLAAIAVARAVTGGASMWEGVTQPERVLAVQGYLALPCVRGVPADGRVWGSESLGASAAGTGRSSAIRRGVPVTDRSRRHPAVSVRKRRNREIEWSARGGNSA